MNSIRKLKGMMCSRLKLPFENSWASVLVLFCFALLFLSSTYKSTVFTIFQGRDLRRAIDLLEGEWIWHGPELVGGGSSPGPFYFWWLALPLSIFKTWQS